MGGRVVGFEVTSADFIARLVRPGFGVAMLPAAYVPHLAGVVTIEVADAPARVEYVIWSRFGRTPAATASSPRSTSRQRMADPRGAAHPS